MKPLQVKIDTSKFDAALKAFCEYHQVELANIGFSEIGGPPSYYIDAFDHLTAQGYKLNLITGKYEKARLD